MKPTAGQTVGPFFHYALPFAGDNQLVSPDRPGAVRLSGVVHDGAGAPVTDALIELWQADPDGRIVQQPGSMCRDPWEFTGWGRCATDAVGEYRFTTLIPGPTSAGRPPFFALTVFARGLLNRLFTRAYLPQVDFDTDPLLRALPPQRRESLVCTTDAAGYRFDIRLQGDRETTFLKFTDQ